MLKKQLLYYRNIISHLRYFDFIYKNPIVVGKLLRNYFKLIILRKNVIRITDIVLTADCNAKCEHCCIDDTVAKRNGKRITKERQSLSLAEIKKIIDESEKMGCIIFNFLGGEPLIYKDIYEVIKYAKKKNAITGITTNGFLLSENVVKDLKAAGLDAVQVDIGGSAIRPEDIDRIRGLKGCYDRAIKGIKLLQKHGIKVIVSTIMTRENVENGEIWKIVENAKELKIKLLVSSSTKVGGWAKNENSVLTPKEYAVLEEILKLPFTRWPGSTNYLSDFCPCGTEKILITTYGDVVPCGFIPISYGSIREEPLAEIWLRMQKNKKICDGKKKKSCRAAWDKETIELNTQIYNSSKRKPISVTELEQLIPDDKQTTTHYENTTG